ncbi:MAG: hypothetical protein V5A68_07420 [Candidatus Thermoplasmatota archaeon]
MIHLLSLIKNEGVSAIVGNGKREGGCCGYRCFGYVVFYSVKSARFDIWKIAGICRV